VKTENQATALQRGFHGLPALPTCGLALAESERMLPGLIDRIGKNSAATSASAAKKIIIRSTGCPNGCSRRTWRRSRFVAKLRDAIRSGLAATPPARASTASART